MCHCSMEQFVEAMSSCPAKRGTSPVDWFKGSDHAEEHRGEVRNFCGRGRHAPRSGTSHVSHQGEVWDICGRGRHAPRSGVLALFYVFVALEIVHITNRREMQRVVLPASCHRVDQNCYTPNTTHHSLLTRRYVYYLPRLRSPQKMMG